MWSAPVYWMWTKSQPDSTIRQMVDSQAYEILRPLHIELLKMQRWASETGVQLLAIFEGRDRAGKGGAIKCITEHLNPRGYRVVALPKPTERERTQWYFQRCISHLPSGGELVFFDRSWYNRAGLERVMGFCEPEEACEFLDSVPKIERMLVRSGITPFKFYFSLHSEEQARRLKERGNNPLRQWQLTPLDRVAQEKWDDYTQAGEEMFLHTSIPEAPWICVDSNDGWWALVNVIRYLLSHLDYPNKETGLLEVDPQIILTIPKVEPNHDS